MEPREVIAQALAGTRAGGAYADHILVALDAAGYAVVAHDSVEFKSWGDAPLYYYGVDAAAAWADGWNAARAALLGEPT